MTTTTKTRRAGAITIAAAALATTALVSGTATAHASEAAPKSKSSSASRSVTGYTLPTYGSSALMPTWVWGSTLLCGFNYGGGYTTLKVQAVLGGARAEYLSVPPFQQVCISRWWAGNPVRTTNLGYSPLYVTGS